MKLLALALFMASLSASAKTSWEKYLDEPTTVNASRVSKMAYSTPIAGGYDAHDLEILRLQVLAADAQAFRLGYRLYKQADGGLAEDLGVILAGTIRSHPEFVLRQVAALKESCSSFEWVLNTPGLEYVDRPRAVAYELQMRQNALKSVRTSSLIGVRNQCLAQLRVTP